MTLTMTDKGLSSIEEIKKFLNSSQKFKFRRKDKRGSYFWIEKTLKKFQYLRLNKEEKGIMKRYIEKVTGYSRAQTTRLIIQYRQTGHIKQQEYQRHRFAKKYSAEDLRLLARTDEEHNFPNGAAVKRILNRMATIYGQTEYKKISQISVGHIYNMRKTVPYLRITKNYTRTKPAAVKIGERRKPEPNGRPGYIRVDTMHQGDRKGEKGVYHINTVDEVTQFEFVAAVEQINEHNMMPLLLKLIEKYPFKIIEFHVDNGSEYINKIVAKLLNKLLITLTKSRPRHTNDNALVETKNGWVLRKWMGYQFIEQKYAAEMNKFYFDYFNEYINFHRPCGFAVEKKDKKGKILKWYPLSNYMTPYEKLKSIPDSYKYLKKGITFKALNEIASSKNDNEMAEIVQKQKEKLFKNISPAYDSTKIFQAH